MGAVDSLPGDQRAVLQLVLGRGRSYDEIARLLSIDSAAVRERALAALDAIGPQTKVDRQDRALIGDYLLGQLPSDEAAQVTDRLSASAGGRAWARVLSSELAPLSEHSLPEIPVAGRSGRRPSRALEPVAAPEPSATPEPVAAPEPSATPEPVAAAEPSAGSEPVAAPESSAPRAATPPPSDPEPDGDAGAAVSAPRSSRLGGAILIGTAVLVVVGVLLYLVIGSGGSSKPRTAASATTPPPAASSTAAASTTPRAVAQINLNPPTPGSKTAGIAEVLDEGAAQGIAIVAQNVPANTAHPPNAYAVWLYNSPTDAHFLGFVNPGVGSNGRLSTAGSLPANGSRYRQLILTVETSASPKTPGQIILQGPLTGVR